MSDAELARLKDENSRFQERTWKVERVGWGLMGAVILLALLGLWSGGPLANATASPPGGGYTLRYERFMRHLSPSQLVLEIAPRGQDPVEVTIGEGLWQALGIQRIHPPPQRSFATADGIRFEFLATGTAGTIVFSLKPEAVGTVSGTFAVSGAGEVELWHLVYP